MHSNIASPASDPIPFGQMIKMKRFVCGLSQEELAKKSHTIQQIISRIERGDFDLRWSIVYAHTIYNVLHVLEINSPSALVNPEDERWRAILLKEIYHRLAGEQFYAIYSKDLLIDSLWKSGCTEKDIHRLIENMPSSVGLRFVDVTPVGCEKNYWVMADPDRKFDECDRES